MHAVVIGAGPVGLVTAMLLAVDGHRVTVLDKDPAESRDLSAALGTDIGKRPGVAQFGQTHILMPAGTHLLERELPGVVERLRAAGAPRHNMIGGAWGVENVGPEQPGDERFETVAARRPVLEAAIFAEAAATPGLTLRAGVQVTGLSTADQTIGASVRVTGVRTRDGETVTADLVVDASGRNSVLPAMLTAIGVSVDQQQEDTGFRYYTRYFRSADGVLPQPRRWPLTHHHRVSVITAPADNDTWSVTLVTSGRDQQLRALSDVDVWQRVAAGYPDIATWLGGVPLTGVRAMGGTESKRRRYTVGDDAPVIGFVAVGDAWATTNPQFGRGMSLGFKHAALLRNVLQLTGADQRETVLRFNHETEAQLSPVWEESVRWDRHRLAEIDAEIEGKPYVTDDPEWAIGVAVDAIHFQDPEILRAHADVASLLAGVDEAVVKTGLVERIIALAAGVPRYTGTGLSREQLLNAVETA